MITNDTDVVRSFSGYTQGKWRLTAYLYVPASTTGRSYYNLEAKYAEQGTITPAVQVELDCDLADNVFAPDWQPVLPRPALARDQWVPIEFLIDLDNDYHESRYNGQLASAGMWSGNFGNSVSFEGIDLFGHPNGGGTVFYDDFSLVAVPEPGAVVLSLLALMLRRRARGSHSLARDAFAADPSSQRP
jgi:hypothetical protein